MQTGDAIKVNATLVKYRFRYLVVGALFSLFTGMFLFNTHIGQGEHGVVYGINIASVNQSIWYGFAIGTVWVVISCLYYLRKLHRGEHEFYTTPLTRVLGAGLAVVGYVLPDMMGAPFVAGVPYLWVSYLTAFLTSPLVGYALLWADEQVSKKMLVVVKERLLWKSLLRVCPSDVYIL